MERRLRREIDALKDHLARLAARQRALPRRVPLADARHGEAPVKLSTERKHLTNVLKLVAFQIESDLVETLRPHCARTEDEGRTLTETATLFPGTTLRMRFAVAEP